MNRREAITLIGGAGTALAMLWPLGAARAAGRDAGDRISSP
jgi:hypothetical protein